MKQCKRCLKEKKLDEFSLNCRKLDGYEIYCKECKSKFAKEYRSRHPETILESKKKYASENREKISKYMKNYRISYKPIRNAREKERLITEPDYMLKKRLRNNILKYLKKDGIKKSCSTSDLLGCSHEFFKSYFESKFVDGMTWEMFCTSDKIHIDHIIPVDAFDLTNEDEVRKCFHYTNLQPLWKKDNLSKSNKLL